MGVHASPAHLGNKENFGQFSVGLRKTDLERELVNAHEYTWLAGISPLFEIQNR